MPPVPLKPPTPPTPPKPPIASALPPVPKPPSDGSQSLRVSLLLPDANAQGPNWRRFLLVLGLVAVIEIAVIGTAYVLLLQRVNAKKVERSTLAERLTALQQQVEEEEVRASEVAKFAVQLDAAGKALDEHRFWSRIFDIIIKRSRPGTRIVNFVGDAAKSVMTIDAIAPNYRLAAEQIVEMRADAAFADVRTTAASARVDETGQLVGVAFTMNVTVKPEAFLNPSEGKNDAPASTTLK